MYALSLHGLLSSIQNNKNLSSDDALNLLVLLSWQCEFIYSGVSAAC